jgi:hypothetical protein
MDYKLISLADHATVFGRRIWRLLAQFIELPPDGVA